MYQQINLHQMKNLNELLAKCYTEGCSDSVWRDRWVELTDKKFEELPGFSMMEAYLWNAHGLAKKVAKGQLSPEVYKQKEFWMDIDYSKVFELIFAYGLENLLRQKFSKKYLGDVYDSFVSHAVDNGHLGIIQYLEPVRTFGRNTVNLESVAKNGHLDLLKYFHSKNKYAKLFTYYEDEEEKKKYRISLGVIIAVRFSARRTANRPDELVFRKPIEPVIEWLLDNDLVMVDPNGIQKLNLHFPRLAYRYAYQDLLSKNKVKSYQILSSEYLSPTQMKVELAITDKENNEYYLDCQYNTETRSFESL